MSLPSELEPAVAPITSACPSCGEVAARHPYDIGDGPELSCVGCEWCWGAEGQPLTPYRPPAGLVPARWWEAW